MMRYIFYRVVMISIEIIPLVLAVFLLRSFTKRRSSQVSYLMWILVFLRLLLPFHISTAHETVLSANIGRVSDTVSDLNGISSGVLIPSQTGRTPSLYDLFLYLWITGMIVFFVYQIVNEFLLRRKLHHAIRERDNICLSENVETPFVHGFFTPKIYLPISTDEDYKKIVLAHEEVHIQRKDYLVKSLACLLTGIHWFNIFVWIANLFLIRDMERSCDERVIEENGIEKADYCRALADTAYPAKGYGPAFRGGELKERIVNVMNHKKQSRIFFAVCAVITALVFLPFLFNHNQRDYIKGSFQQRNAGQSKEITLSSTGITLSWPVEDPVISCDYGCYLGHRGVDITEDHLHKTGKVYSTAPGEVVETGYNDTDGNYVVLKHLNGYYSFYSHMDEVIVSEGEKVDGVIGEMGDTGLSSGVHLHFAVCDQNYSYISNISELLANR